MTSQQLKLLRFIRNKIVHTNVGPTFKEMREFMKVSSNQTIDDFLSALQKENYITIIQGKQRGIVLTQKAQHIEREQKIEKQITIPETFISFSSNSSTSFIYNVQNANGINLQSNTLLPWEKGGEKNGST